MLIVLAISSGDPQTGGKDEINSSSSSVPGVLADPQHIGLHDGVGETNWPQEALEDMQLSDSNADLDIQSTTPLKEMVKEVGNVITCLYRLSIAIQSPASRDRLEKMEKIDMSFFEPFDIEHVSNKFQLGDEYIYLLERLGKANTKRRQILKYHHDHHGKIIGRRVITDAEESAGGFDSADGIGIDENDYLSEAPSAMHTAVSTVYEGNVDLVGVEAQNLDSRSEAGFSQTSCASSTTESDNPRVPAPPPGFDMGPFQCPYCFCIVETTNRTSWK
jgi:hypothetical protein